MSQEIIDTTGKIVMGHFCGISAKETSKYDYNHELIDHSDFNEYDLSKGFIEFNGLDFILEGKHYTQKYIRLYFDVDCKSDSKEEAMKYYNAAMKFMNDIKFDFGDYAVCGYSNNSEIAEEIKCRYNENAEKILSLHIVFYEKCLFITDLLKLFDENKYNIPYWIDKSVYEISQRRAFRHGKSPKYITWKDCCARDQTKFTSAIGEMLNDKNDEDLLITPTEENIKNRVLDINSLLVWFDKKHVGKNTHENPVADLKQEDYEEIIEEINNYEYKVIEEINVIDDPKCLELMLKCFEPTHSSLEKLCCIIGASPFDQELLLKYFESWYFFEGHTHNNLSTVDGYFKKYYKFEESNKWFYSCLKHLNDDVRKAFLNKFSFNTIDESVKFDVWNAFTLDNIVDNIVDKKYFKFETREIDDDKLIKNAQKLNKKYIISEEKNKKGGVESMKVEMSKINYGKLITDLKNCFVIINTTPQTYIFKDFDGKSNGFKLNETHKEAVAFNKLKKITINYVSDEMKEKKTNIWDIICQNNNSRYLTYADSAFYSEHPKVFSYYYNPFKINKDFDIVVDESKTDRKTMNKLELFWNHVKNVIAKGDETSYNYIKNWIIRPLQKPNNKNKSALIIAGKEQGTGKTWTAEIIAKLHGHFGEANVGNMKTICGDFNAKLINKTLVVVNEVNNVDNSIWYNGDALKSLITEDSVIIEKKGIDPMTYDNCINFIFVSNNERPINLDNEDRRYAVFEPNPIHGKNDFEYWSEEFYGLKDDQQFLADLYNWCLKQDISKFNPRNIPMTEAKMELIAQNRPRHEEFIIEHLKYFQDGFEKQECFTEYVYWCNKNGYKNPGNIKTFTNNLSDYIVWTQQKDSKSGQVSRVLPKKQISGKRSYIFKLTDDKYNELSACADVSDDESEDERPVLMRVEDDE